MKKAMIYGFMAALTLTLSVACGKKDDDSKAAVGGREGARVAGPSGLPTMAYNREMVNITNANAQQMQIMAKALASASIDPQYVGNVTNVQLQGDVSVDRNTGAVIVGTSAMQITITDDLTGTNQGEGVLEPIRIYVPAMSGGASNSQVNLTFGDNAGTITLVGAYNQTTFTGTVSFNNLQGPGYQGVRSGTLGQFTVPVCGFFRCQ